MQRKLTEIYHTPSNPAGYGGLQKLQEATGATQSDLREFAENEDIYQKFKPARKKFARAEMKYEPYNSLWACDMIHLKSLAPYNDNKKYWLMVIETLSRQLSIELLETLKGDEMVAAFRRIIAKRKSFCKNLWTDSGTDFFNPEMRLFTSFYRVNHYSTGNETKCFLVERLNRTILQKLWPILAKRNTWRYINILDQVVESYNNSRHSSLGVSPNSINANNYVPILNKLNKRFRKQDKKPKYKRLQKVRIQYLKGPFQKSYSQTFSNATYIIDRVVKQTPKYVYHLKTQDNKKILGGFYHYQIVPTSNLESE